jgi:hypothetical protein
MHTLTRPLILLCSPTLLAAVGCVQQTPAQTQADIDQAAARGARDAVTAREESDRRIDDAQRGPPRKEEDVSHAPAASDR